jgi:peptidylprolyl isomerase
MRHSTKLALAFVLIATPACSEQPDVLAANTAVPAAVAPAGDPANTLIIETRHGKIAINLRPDLAPQHVERVKTLAKQGFYNGQKFHRVIAGFMAQTGDPTGTGMGGSKLPDLPAEFTQEPYLRGTVGAARTADPNTANSQFFICFTDNGCSFLKGKYTVWGRVASGMEAVDKIARGEPPAEPDVMQKVYLQSDAK